MEKDLDLNENILNNNNLINITPIYSLNNLKWNFPDLIQNKIRNENFNDFNKNLNNFFPYIINNCVNDKINKFDINLYFNCICNNFKNPYCVSFNCKFPYSKFNNLLNENNFKDGLEILDIPSNYLNNIEKRKKNYEN